MSLIQGMASGRVVMGADAAGLAGHLEALGQTPERFWLRASAAARRARATFEPGAVARQTLAVYRTVAAQVREKMDGTPSRERTSLPH